MRIFVKVFTKVASQYQCAIASLDTYPVKYVAYYGFIINLDQGFWNVLSNLPQPSSKTSRKNDNLRHATCRSNVTVPESRKRSSIYQLIA